MALAEESLYLSGVAGGLAWAGLLSCAGLGGMVAVRAVLEEQVLKDELHGYQAYVARVRYRLIPHVW